MHAPATSRQCPGSAVPALFTPQWPCRRRQEQHTTSGPTPLPAERSSSTASPSQCGGRSSSGSARRSNKPAQQCTPAGGAPGARHRQCRRNSTHLAHISNPAGKPTCRQRSSRAAPAPMPRYGASTPSVRMYSCGPCRRAVAYWVGRAVQRSTGRHAQCEDVQLPALQQGGTHARTHHAAWPVAAAPWRQQGGSPHNTARATL